MSVCVSESLMIASSKDGRRVEGTGGDVPRPRLSPPVAVGVGRLHYPGAVVGLSERFRNTALGVLGRRNRRDLAAMDDAPELGLVRSQAEYVLTRVMRRQSLQLELMGGAAR